LGHLRQERSNRRTESEQGGEDADGRIDNQAVAEVVATREVGICDGSDSSPGRQLDDGHAETQTGQHAVDDHGQHQEPEDDGQRRFGPGTS